MKHSLGHARAGASMVFFCCLLQLAVSIAVRRQPADAGSSPHAHLDERADALTGAGAVRPDCSTVQPASLLQSLGHPWTGNYKSKTYCQEVAILKNTAALETCGILHTCASLWFVPAILIAFCSGVVCVTPTGWFVAVASMIASLVVPFLLSLLYVLQTGLLEDYLSGAMSWDVRATTGVEPHNVSLPCLQLVSFVYIFGIVLAFNVFLWVLFGCCLGLGALLATRMKAERQVTKHFIPREDSEYIDSDEFKTKCVKAFREADADHNGVLDLAELQQVALFDLTDEERRYVQEGSLFKEAFEKCDADKSQSIDETEFVELMKFIMTKAKFGVRGASSGIDAA